MNQGACRNEDVSEFLEEYSEEHAGVRSGEHGFQLLQQFLTTFDLPKRLLAEPMSFFQEIDALEQEKA